MDGEYYNNGRTPGFGRKQPAYAAGFGKDLYTYDKFRSKFSDEKDCVQRKKEISAKARNFPGKTR